VAQELKMFREILKSVFRLTSFSASRFVTLFGGARPMNEEADVTEVVEAIERLRRGYQKPFPASILSDQPISKNEVEEVASDSTGALSSA
jgi:hypothetical protein